MKQHVLNTMQYLTIKTTFLSISQRLVTHMVVAEQCVWSCFGDLSWPFVLGRFPNLVWNGRMEAGKCQMKLLLLVRLNALNC